MNDLQERRKRSPSEGHRIPAVLTSGFRPFFLLGSLMGGLSVLAWLPLWSGQLATASHFAPVDWHTHELLFGFFPAVLTGFLLTAIPNWTGRLPVQGWPLGLLVLLWLIGRLAILVSAHLPWPTVLVVDCFFLAAVAAAAMIEVSAGRNWRNLKVIAPLVVLLAANAFFHLEVAVLGAADIAPRLGLASAVYLIMVTGGRIIPSFTRNWLVRKKPGRLPRSFGEFDLASLCLSAVALAMWSFAPERSESGVLLLTAGVMNAARMARWAGDRTVGEPLVLVMHLAYAFVPIGLILSGLAVIWPDNVPRIAGIHTFGVGAIGAMTLAVMTRATLGHTGRELRANSSTIVLYAAILLAAPLRLAAVFVPNARLLEVSAGLWTLAFLGYCVCYGPLLLRTRRQRRAA